MKVRTRPRPNLTINAAKTKRRKGGKVKGSRVLKVDPTRSVTVRRAFVARLRKQFARLRMEVADLVAREDAFGLAEPPIAVNASDCGAGGEGDPGFQPGNTCGAGGRLHAPKDFDEAKSRFDEVGDKLGGRETRQGPGLRQVNLPGERWIKADLMELRDNEWAVGIDFGIGREDADFQHESLQPGSLELIKEVRRLVMGYHQAGFKISVIPSDERRKVLYEKSLKRLGFKLERELNAGAKQVWNYDPDQPRDEAGRWTDIGGISSELVAKGKGLATYRVLTRNVFCPTGPGGGVDPTCSPNKFSTLTHASNYAHLRKLNDGVGSIYDVEEFEPAHLALHNRNNVKPLIKFATDRPNEFEKIRTVALFDLWRENKIEGSFDSFTSSGKVKVYRGVQPGAPLSSRSWTTDRRIAEAFSKHGAEIGFRFGEGTSGGKVLESVKSVNDILYYSNSQGEGEVVLKEPTDNQLLINAGRWSFLPLADKLRAFRDWLAGKVKQFVLSENDHAAWDRYVERGYEKGAGRAYDDVAKTPQGRAAAAKAGGAVATLPGFEQGAKHQFMRLAFGPPESKQKVDLLKHRTFDDLKGVTERMSATMGRVLADGMEQGEHPKKVARLLAAAVDMELGRAEMIAQTEFIRAHAEGQLLAMEALGVTEVGVMVEWQTAGPPYYSQLTPKERRTITHVCKKCEAMEGVTLPIDEAHGMIPKHPRCRCSWTPATFQPTENRRRRPVIHNSGCGSGEEGAPGFQPGNTCGAGNGGSMIMMIQGENVDLAQLSTERGSARLKPERGASKKFRDWQRSVTEREFEAYRAWGVGDLVGSDREEHLKDPAERHLLGHLKNLLDRAPDNYEGEAYRGINLSKDDAAKLKPGQTMEVRGITSFTNEHEQAVQYAFQSPLHEGGGEPVLLRGRLSSGIEIGRMSLGAFDRGDTGDPTEVLLRDGSLKIKSVKSETVEWDGSPRKVKVVEFEHVKVEPARSSVPPVEGSLPTDKVQRLFDKAVVAVGPNPKKIATFMYRKEHGRVSVSEAEVSRWLELTGNVYCPTGPGGGVDPTCSPRIVYHGTTERVLASIAEKGLRAGLAEGSDAYEVKTGGGNYATSFREAGRSDSVYVSTDAASASVYGAKVSKLRGGDKVVVLKLEVPSSRLKEDEAGGTAKSLRIEGGVDPSAIRDILDIDYDRDEFVSRGLITNAGRWSTNVFCPTGPGGGVDPTCSPGGTRQGAIDEESGSSVPQPATDPVNDVAKSYIESAKQEWSQEHVKRSAERVKEVLIDNDPKWSRVHGKIVKMAARKEALEKAHQRICDKINKMMDRDMKAMQNREAPVHTSDEYTALGLKADEALGKYFNYKRDLDDKAWREIGRHVSSKENQLNTGAGAIRKVELNRNTSGDQGRVLDESQEKAVAEVEKRLSGRVSGLLQQRINETDVRSIKPEEEQRAYFKGTRHGGDAQSIYLPKGYKPETVAHELGHSLETKSSVYNAARGFLYLRVGDEECKPMGEGYKSWEVGRDDDFGSRYVGKHYKSFDTEITSMGLERMYSDPVGFAKRDPQYFKFMLGVLDGTF